MKASEARDMKDLMRIEMALAVLSVMEPEYSSVIDYDDYEDMMIHLLQWHEKLCKKTIIA
jgi:hypothetical protein